MSSLHYSCTTVTMAITHTGSRWGCGGLEWPSERVKTFRWKVVTPMCNTNV